MVTCPSDKCFNGWLPAGHGRCVRVMTLGLVKPFTHRYIHQLAACMMSIVLPIFPQAVNMKVRKQVVAHCRELLIVEWTYKENNVKCSRIIDCILYLDMTEARERTMSACRSCLTSQGDLRNTLRMWTNTHVAHNNNTHMLWIRKSQKRCRRSAGASTGGGHGN